MALGDVPCPRPLPGHRIDEPERVVVAQRSQRVERIHDHPRPISSSRPLSNHARVHASQPQVTSHAAGHSRVHVHSRPS